MKFLKLITIFYIVGLSALNLKAQSTYLKGALITETYQLRTMKKGTNSNTYAAIARSTQDITNYLNENAKKKRRLVSVIGIIDLLIDNTGFYSATAIPQIVEAVQKSKNKGRRIIWMYDEPLWRIFSQCLQNNQSHCNEVNQDYSNVLKKLEEIDNQLNAALGTTSFHVEGYPVLSSRHSNGKEPVFMKSSLFLGMDCYENFDSCGDDRFPRYSIPQYYSMVQSFLDKMENTSPMGRKLAIVPTAFTGPWVQNPVLQLDQYAMWLRNPEIKNRVGLIGFFMWGSFIEGSASLEGAGTSVGLNGDWVIYSEMRRRMKANF